MCRAVIPLRGFALTFHSIAEAVIALVDLLLGLQSAEKPERVAISFSLLVFFSIFCKYASSFDLTCNHLAGILEIHTCFICTLGCLRQLFIGIELLPFRKWFGDPNAADATCA